MVMNCGHFKTVVPKVLVISVMLGMMSNVFAADYKIVANKSVSAGSLSKSELQAIFLGEKSKWDDGKPIKIVVLEEGGAHKAFLQSVVGKTPSQFESYWKKLVFTGKAAAPKAFGDASSLVDFVAGHSGAIGYVADGQSVGSVKTISIK
jgi:ABC-type phosphate transport system substrate-binding protein